jgi:hypothetical protein
MMQSYPGGSLFYELSTGLTALARIGRAEQLQRAG